MYIIPGTSGHANIYKNMKGKKLDLLKEYLFSRALGSTVDFGASIFPYGKSTTCTCDTSLTNHADVYNVPKWWAACSVSSNIVFWREHKSGGHFAATEKPVELVQDIRDFTKVFKSSKLAVLKESGKLKK